MTTKTLIGRFVSVSLGTGYMTISEAAAALGVKPYEVVRLIDAGEVKTVTLIDAASLPKEIQ